MNKNILIQTGIFIFLIMGLSQCDSKKPEIPKAENGVLDLRGWNFQNNGTIELSGQWKFLWYKDIPSDIPENKLTNFIKKTGGIFDVPGVWNRQNLGPMGYGWFVLEILFDETNSRELGLKLINIYTASEIYVDDNLILECGKAGNTKEETFTEFVPTVISFPQKKSVTIKWKISNFHYIFGGPAHSPLIGNFLQLQHEFSYSRFIQSMLLGIMLIMAVYHLALWGERKGDRGSLYFALFCFVIFFRTLAVNHFLGLFIFPHTNFAIELSYKLNFLSFTLGPLFFAAFFRNLFPEEFSERVMRIIMISCLTGTAIILLTSSDIFTSMLYGYLIVMAIISIWIIISIVRAILNNREGAVMMQVGFVLFFAAIFHDTLYALKIIYTGRIIDIAMILFIFLQSRALAFRYARAYKTAKYLSKNLQREVDRKTSELKAREEELLKTNRKLQEMDQFKTTFFQNITHELQTPLTLILSPVTTLLKGTWGKLTEQVKKQLFLVQRQSQRLTNLINQLLDLTRIDLGREKVKVCATDMNHYLSMVFSQFEYLAQSRKIRFKLKIPKHSPKLFIDRDQINKVLVNLISNAFKFTPDFGHITLSLTKRIANNISENSWVDICVSDNGIGIAEDELNSIFERFHRIDNTETRKTGGTGIGLALVKEYIHLHHGSIKVRSTPDKGSQFCISLQMGKAHFSEEDFIDENPELRLSQSYIDYPSSEIDDTSHFPQKSNIHLLIVEDNEDLRKYLSELLSKEYFITEAKNGLEGLEKAIDLIPDLILCDIMMPTMDGLSFIEKLATINSTKNIPFIFLSAKKGLDDKLKGLSKGAVDYITKPFEIEELEAKIASLLKHKHLSKEAHFTEMENRILKKLNMASYSENGKKKKISLAPKEKEIISLIIDGKRQAEIAKSLYLSISAVKKRISKIYEKCGVKKKSELIKLFEQGDIF